MDIMATKINKNIKVVNNMPNGGLGLELANGKKKTLPKPDAFTEITQEDIWHIFNTCRTIQKGYLFIDDKSMRIELELEDDEGGIDVNAMSREDLKVIVVDKPISELKDILESDLSDGTKEKIVVLAREIYNSDGMDARKVSLIEKETNMPISESDGSEIKITNDVKEKKKVTTKPKTE